MSDYRSKRDDHKFHNWMKTGLALMYTKEGLHDFVLDEIEKFKKKAFSDILAELNLPPYSSCQTCSTEQIVCQPSICKKKTCAKVHRPCPLNGLCDRMRDKITLVHRYKDPSWKNTDASKWHEDSYQIAKCFMPKEGYTHKKSFMETDFNGIICVILNYKGFQNIVKENLSQKSNLFCKAREISRLFRHSANFEIDDNEFTEYIQNLMALLKDPKYLASKKSTNAVLEKISKLCKESWEVTPAKDVVYVLNEELCYDETETKAIADGISAGKRTLLRKSREIVSDIPEDIESLMSQLMSHNQFGHTLRQDIIERLIISYQEQCSTLPISALVKEEDAQLLEFFAKPTLKQVDHHNIKSQPANIRSYEDIFFKNGRACKNIYITGDAGIGKTAFCQRMILAWCHANSGKKEDHNFSAVDIDVMKKFPFLFYVSLRETKLCRIQQMIQKQFQDVGHANIIAHILDKEKCLIILDGLDEWTHPTVQTTCPPDRKLPHRPVSNNCVYLTTTRPWKLEGNRLKTNEIDQQIEIIGLSKHSCNELVISVITHLNKKLEVSRDPQDFQNEVVLNKLQKVCEVPIILVQLICLWFEERTIGTSRCSIYSETIEMLFTRVSEIGIMRDASVYQTRELIQGDIDRKLPDCLCSLQAVSKHVSLLYKLGHLAFEGLFGKSDGESGLIFTSAQGEIFDISEAEMTYLLFVGILSKNKVVGTLSKRKVKLNFLHKSFQEFFAAVYIAMQEDKNDCIERIFRKCVTLRTFLRFENVYTFLSGMRSELVNNFSERIKAIMVSDKQISMYRKYSEYKFGFVVMLPPFSILTDPKFSEVQDAEKLLQSYQTLALQCQEESRRSQSRRVVLPLEDVFIPNTCSDDLNSLLVLNKTNLKSITTEKYHGELSDVKNVEKISIDFQSHEDSLTINADMEKYEKCLIKSIQTLQCLSISNSRGMLDLRKLQFANLRSIDLYNIVLKHQEISDLFSFISNKTDLIQILMFHIKCSEHDKECKGSTLNLIHHNELEFLRLHQLYEYGQHETRINCTNLGTLIFEDSSRVAHKTSSLLLDLINAPRLFEVTLLGISLADTFRTLLSVLPSLKHLKRLSLYNCDFGDSHVVLDSESQIEIERICLLNSSLTLDALRRMVDSIPVNTDNVVSVHMQSCKFLIREDTTLQEGAEAARNYVMSNSRFNIFICDPFNFYFQTIKSGQ